MQVSNIDDVPALQVDPNSWTKVCLILFFINAVVKLIICAKGMDDLISEKFFLDAVKG